MKLIVLITSQIENGLDVAQAWQNAGAPGVTILRGYGLYSLQNEVHSGGVELPRIVSSMAGALAAMMNDVEEQGELILSLVEDNLVDRLIAAAMHILGDLEQPEQGILFVIDVEQAIGVRRHAAKP